ncbi:mandelate racemase/muconate lactonizing enzyme family protein [Pantoea sp. CCBC3-3-1]|uniref:mandelate racemase/muconate lactonizing enzyme family protein n=1 Tax=Pantoea sp. CCBC3-3-1 TaxID=2490851 RepID=UPI0011BE5E5A|nr:mandelate racemase/muconate lactonizing enzyme family protein [Pantoea sp. CCBC3-3-1]
MSKIKHVNIYRAVSPLSRPLADATHSLTEISFFIVELELDNGMTGEGYLLSFHYSPQAIIGALNDIKDSVIGYYPWQAGKYISDTEKEHEYFGHNGLQKWALATFNVAMWDAWGKMLHQPVHKLLGTYVDKVPVYGSGGWISYSEQELVEEVSDYKRRGFRAVKIKVGSPTIEEDIARLTKVREAVGPELNIMMDANQGMTLPSAIKLSEKSAALGIHWFEEPLNHTHFDGYQLLRNKTGIALAMGEREYDLEPLKNLISRNALDLWQPDIIRIGGVEAWRTSAALAQAHHIPVLPHYYKDYDVPLLCTIPNGYGAESFDWIDNIIDNAMPIVDGYARPRETPGWGFSFLKSHLTEVRSGGENEH